jgi:hypothetical protein
MKRDGEIQWGQVLGGLGHPQDEGGLDVRSL